MVATCTPHTYIHTYIHITKQFLNPHVIMRVKKKKKIEYEVLVLPHWEIVSQNAFQRIAPLSSALSHIKILWQRHLKFHGFEPKLEFELKDTIIKLYWDFID